MKRRSYIERRSFLGAAAATVLAPRVFSAPSRPLLSLGLIADAQYADVPAAGTRFYRQSIEKLGSAIELFNKLDLGFCVHLGDLIDRKWDSFDAILKPLAQANHTRCRSPEPTLVPFGKTPSRLSP